MSARRQSIPCANCAVPSLMWLVCAACAGAAAVRSPYPHPDGLFAEVHTPKGVFVIDLAFDKTPMTVANFVGLAEGTIRNDAFSMGTPFFDGSTFHRVVPGHVIQGGIPASEEADGSGTAILNEIDRTLSHSRAGMVGMANAGPHTATNQFYVTLGDRSYLDGDYAVFGEVVQGMDIVMRIVQDDAIDSIRIVRVGGVAAAFRPTTERFLELVATVRRQVAAEEQRKHAAEADYLRRHWPNPITTEAGWQYVVLREGTGTPPAVGDTLSVRYTGQTAFGLQFGSAGDGGEPGWLAPGTAAGATFVFAVGTTTVTPGFDDAVAQMRRGERRVVIVPATSGYARSGYYAPPRRREKRFVISPNTLLIYMVEVLP